MEPDPLHEALVAPLRADVISGATVVGRTAAEVLRRAAIRLRAGSPEEFQWALAEVCTRVLEAQPAMAPLITLVREVLGAIETSEDVEGARHAAARAAEAFRNAIESRAEAVAERAAGLLAHGSRVATVSSSSTVKAALLHEASALDRHVICYESRPMNEGRAFAAGLAEAGIDVTLAVDAAAAALMPDVDVVLLGADSIGDLGVVNKIGSAVLVEAANRLSVPVIVLADQTKVLPRGFPQHLADDRPSSDVWDAPPPGVRIWNRYFEAVPLASVSNIVTESATMTPAEVETMRASLEWPHGLWRLMENPRDRARPGPRG